MTMITVVTVITSFFLPGMMLVQRRSGVPGTNYGEQNCHFVPPKK